MIEVKYDRVTLLEEYNSKSKKHKRWKEYEECTAILQEVENKEKEEGKIPHSIAVYKAMELWKFFRSTINGKHELLPEPRYKLRIGNDWFDIKGILYLPN